ncbi:hypothetical protein BDB00DRAFT_837495 [Zychaea mexicana]|uniref:uncharacterized protein n=1 Tax=Zychaea mexicana TaxID=64656 RepID=UPI0022FE1247|nr:uncharacterized protein BDB00DRAFT_837495 [Zychaea mexicana]KAI9490516.1 hypothetical protein BDB00DRAFT_837495 [Zychaea mexicana]
MSHKRKREDDNSANPYVQERPHFGELAEQFPVFRPFVHTDKNENPYIDFKDSEAVRTLTWCLLKRDFGLDVKLPADRLCPPVPNRLDYILWIEDILKETLPTDQFDMAHGIDIGVGASCIYPLLCCARHKDWKFDGTDIDETSVRIARDNIRKNKMNDRITIQYNSIPERIFLLDEGKKYTFCMCNPPFYASEEEVEQSLQTKQAEPFAICTGTKNEMITDGGEYGFIQRMMNESLIYKDRIMWYTSLIGLKKSVRPLVDQLESFGINNYVVSEFIQGRTKRWAIAWSFGPKRLHKVHNLVEYRAKLHFVSYMPKPVSYVREQVIAILQDLNISFEQDGNDPNVITGKPRAITWSRAARRLLNKKQKIEENELPIFEFQFALLEEEEEEEREGDKQLDGGCRIASVWLQGDKRTAFESFWFHVERRVQEACGVDRGSTFNSKSGAVSEA